MSSSTRVTARRASLRTASPSPRRSSSKTSSRTWARKCCAKWHRRPATSPAKRAPRPPSMQPNSILPIATGVTRSPAACCHRASYLIGKRQVCTYGSLGRGSAAGNLFCGSDCSARVLVRLGRTLLELRLPRFIRHGGHMGGGWGGPRASHFANAIRPVPLPATNQTRLPGRQLG
jgi:hypothetical protein